MKINLLLFFSVIFITCCSNINSFNNSSELPIENAVKLFENEKYLVEAINNLKKASMTESNNQKLWYLLSVAYGRSGKIGISRYASAYSAYLKGDDTLALSFIQRAKKIVKKNSIDWNKIVDLESKINLKK